MLSSRLKVLGLFIAASAQLLADDLNVVPAETIPSAIMPAGHFDTIDLYCIDCHGNDTMEGSVNLEELNYTISTDLKTAETWQKVLNALNSGEMPPKDEIQLESEEKIGFLEDLSVQLVTARDVLSDSGGIITLRRLNRREYQYTLEEILGVAPDTSNLPDDQAGAEFDTSGASLFFSSDQLEQYLNTARATLRLALFPEAPVKPKTMRVEPEEFYTEHYAKAAEGLRDIGARSRAFLAQKEKPASDYGLLDEYQAKKQAYQEWLPLLEDYLARPETKTGAAMIVTIKQGGVTKVKLPTMSERAAGEYLIRVRAGLYPDADERFRYLEFSTSSGSGRKFHGWRKVSAPLDDPEIIEFTYTHQPGEKNQIWIHQRTHQDRADKELNNRDMLRNGLGTPPGIWVDWAELEGPFSDIRRAEVRAEVLFDQPTSWTDAHYIKVVLHRFADRVFRSKTPDPEFMKLVYDQYLSQLKKGRSRKEAFIEPLAIILSAPSFLYMVEATGDTKSDLLSDQELATRLSYFLWSSPPDVELMDLAKEGRLSDPVILQQQTDRMLTDHRADRFVRDFTYQWLELERLETFQFNGLQYPDFDNAVRGSAREEIFQTMHTLLKERLPLPTLLKADFVVVNDVMAGYYDIPDVDGPEFRKVKLPDNALRGGLLGTAAVLAMGSDGVRSSPVERGAWVLRHLLNRPPPPAPPNVPQLGRLAGEILGARELGRAHMEEPQCAQCHNKIDPIGFALENFDATGKWREKEIVHIGPLRKGEFREFPIDAQGHLPGGVEFANYFGLRDEVAKRPDAFAHGFTKALITYSLGRPFGFTDQTLAESILDQAKAGHYDPNLFVHALVQSPTFQHK